MASPWSLPERHQLVDVAHGVSGALAGQVGRVGRAPSGGLAGMDLYQLALEIELHRLGGGAGRRRTCRPCVAGYRVNCPEHLDMVVRVDLGLGVVRRVVGCRRPGNRSGCSAALKASAGRHWVRPMGAHARPTGCTKPPPGGWHRPGRRSPPRRKTWTVHKGLGVHNGPCPWGGAPGRRQLGNPAPGSTRRRVSFIRGSVGSALVITGERLSGMMTGKMPPK